VAPFTGGGYTHELPQGAARVVLIPSYPVSIRRAGLGNHLVDNGFTVAMRRCSVSRASRPYRIHSQERRKGLCYEGIAAFALNKARPVSLFLRALAVTSTRRHRARSRGDRPMLHRRLRFGRRRRRQRAAPVLSQLRCRFRWTCATPRSGLSESELSPSPIAARTKACAPWACGSAKTGGAR